MSTTHTFVGDTVILGDSNENIVSTAAISHHENQFPIEVEARFSCVRRIGRGGAGLIYQAFDNVLERNVALKFLLNPHNNQSKMVLEARAQANVEHPNICPIYEVIQSEHGTYLVMQYIEGMSLEELAPELTLEQILLLFKKVIIGLQSAHSHGLIHRDFKPANIMVNLSADSMEPLVIDFGLAAEADNRSGAPTTGTPYFIAPELYDKTINKIDRRCDIYAIGASMLFCLTKELIPHNDSTPRLTRLQHTKLPTDLQVIIAKCMAQEPLARYQSALELAADITCFLNGEPISARTGKLYWFKQKLIKHRWLVSAATIAIVVIIGLIARQQYDQAMQSTRQQALLDFNSTIKELEYQAQLTYMSPVHNTEAKHHQWLQQALELETKLSSVNSILLGSTHYVIGRIYHLLGEEKKAVHHLEEAHRLDGKEQAAFYLALSYGALFNQEYTTLLNIADADIRHSRQQNLEQRLKEPAIKLLTQHIDSAPYQSYAQALLAYYQRDWAGAINILDNSKDLPSWYFQDELLYGDIFLAKASELHEAGVNYDQVMSTVEQATDYYQKAKQLAPSSLDVNLRPLTAKLMELRVRNQSGQKIEQQVMLNLQQSYDKILMINANNFNSHHIFGQLAHVYSMNQHYTSGVSQDWLTVAENKLLVASKLKPKSSAIWFSLGSLYASIIQQQRTANINTDVATQNAINALKNVAEQHKDYYYFNELGTLTRFRALQVRESSTPERSSILFEQAIGSYIEANRRFPQHIGSLVNAASTMRNMSETSKPAERSAMLQGASTILNRVLAVDGNHFVANYYATAIAIDKIELALYRGVVQEINFDRANSLLEKAKSINSDNTYLLDLEGFLLQFEAEKEFTDNQQWTAKFDNVIDYRKELAEQFPHHTIVVKNYIGIICWVTAMRIQLGLPADDYVQQLNDALDTYPDFENSAAIKALSELFQHWNNPNIKKLNLVEKYQLNNKSSFSHQWALAMILIATAEMKEEINQATEKLRDNQGLLPAYRRLIEQWAQKRSQQLP